MSPVLLLSSASVVGIVLLLIAARLSVARWVRWARSAAFYGTADILNARYVDSDAAVSQLRAQFDAWSTVVKEGTAEFCRTIDAHRVQFFETSATDNLRAFNDEHRYILQATETRVARLLDLATRIECGETRLRSYFVPGTRRA
jgi:hypothetical protein